MLIEMNVSSVCEQEWTKCKRRGSSRCVMSDSDEGEGYGVDSTGDARMSSVSRLIAKGRKGKCVELPIFRFWRGALGASRARTSRLLFKYVS